LSSLFGKYVSRLLPGDPLQVIKRFVKIAGIPNLEKFFQKEREKTAFAVSWAISYFFGQLGVVTTF